ncbi:MAG: cysteine hydrolase [Firmicutes bacterium]|nr:cysteine hydrolase [Bacillota bacterium]
MSYEELLRDSNEFIKKMINQFSTKEAVKIDSLNPNETVLIIIDVINGFAKEGILKSDRVDELIPQISDLLSKCIDNGIEIIAFADNHPEDSPEFTSYPKHCLEGTRESEMVDELKKIGGYKLIKKNSTNGFLEDEYQNWLKSNLNIKNFIIVGDCTDICIEQFANTQKAYFNKNNKNSRIIVPMDMVDTFDLDTHKGDLLNLMALCIMEGNGVEIVSSIS